MRDIRDAAAPGHVCRGRRGRARRRVLTGALHRAEHRHKLVLPQAVQRPAHEVVHEVVAVRHAVEHTANHGLLVVLRDFPEAEMRRAAGRSRGGEAQRRSPMCGRLYGASCAASHAAHVGRPAAWPRGTVSGCDDNAACGPALPVVAAQAGCGPPPSVPARGGDAHIPVPNGKLVCCCRCKRGGGSGLCAG